MKKQTITLYGRDYNFETHDKKTSLVYYSKTRPAAENHIEIVYIPSCKVVTRTNGDILFALALKPGDTFEILTAKVLYDRYAWQWFEPLADNYHELIYLNNEEVVQDAYKHFSWEDIVRFSEKDRTPVAFSKGMSGDWKASQSGASGYLLVQVNGKPYWADAIGQIPYAVDTFRFYRSIDKTVETAMQWADGTAQSNYDNTNNYDNFFVLRGALYASRRFTYSIISSGRNYPAVNVLEKVNFVDSAVLSQPISESELALYGQWKR